MYANLSDRTWTTHPYCVRAVRTPCVLSPQPPYSLRTLSVVSTRSPCCLRGWTSVLSNVIRGVRTLTALHPSLSAAIRGKCWLICPPATASVLSPYSVREISSVLYPLRSAASVRRCERGITSGDVHGSGRGKPRVGSGSDFCKL